MRYGLIVGGALILSTYGAIAQDLKSKFLDNFANAIVVGTKCIGWKVNPKMAMPVMAFFHVTTADISPGGADWPVFQQDIKEAEANVDGLDDNKICTAAEQMFGPNGVVAPNLMIRSPSPGFGAGTKPEQLPRTDPGGSWLCLDGSKCPQ